jgi:hypothetical protein
MKAMLSGKLISRDLIMGRMVYSIYINQASTRDHQANIYLPKVNGARSATLRLPAAHRSPPTKRPLPSRRPRRTSTTSTFHTTTRRTRTARTLVPKPSNSLRTGRTLLPAEPAGNVLPSWSMFRARAPRAVPAALERSGSVSCCLISGRTRRLLALLVSRSVAFSAGLEDWSLRFKDAVFTGRLEFI